MITSKLIAWQCYPSGHKYYLNESSITDTETVQRWTEDPTIDITDPKGVEIDGKVVRQEIKRIERKRREGLPEVHRRYAR